MPSSGIISATGGIMIEIKKIVIADDMEPILLYLEKVISKEQDFKVVGKASNGEELIELVVSYKPDLVITDVEMPKCDGIQAIEELNKMNIKTKYIIVTGNYSSIMTSKAKEIGILGVIKKPILDDKKLISQIKEALK